MPFFSLAPPWRGREWRCSARAHRNICQLPYRPCIDTVCGPTNAIRPDQAIEHHCGFLSALEGLSEIPLGPSDRPHFSKLDSFPVPPGAMQWSTVMTRLNSLGIDGIIQFRSLSKHRSEAARRSNVPVFSVCEISSCEGLFGPRNFSDASLIVLLVHYEEQARLEA